MRVGILAVQGDVEAHARALRRSGARPVSVLYPRDLARVSALILPGGESTTMAKGLSRLELYEAVVAFAGAGRPILGTCAGAILLARRARNQPVRTLGLIDLDARRNAYGTQVDSFASEADADSANGFAGFRCVFIRAPRLERLGAAVEVLVRVDGEPVLVREAGIMACSFHPELTDDLRVHAHFLKLADSLPVGRALMEDAG